MKKFFTLRTLGLAATVLAISQISAQVTLGTSPYTQDFNSIGTGLPTGWTGCTGATTTALGNSQTLLTSTTAWATTTGQFANFASANSPSSSGDNSSTQSGRTDRCLGVRTVGTFGDPGAAFVLQIANTSGKTAFNLSFKLQSLDIASPRTTTWTVDFGFGATPASFTAATTSPATITTGGSTFTNTTVTVNFGGALDNNAGPVWVRVAALSGSSGSNNRPTTGIDDVSLSWTAGGPSLSASALTAFGALCINGTYGPNSFTLTGSNLTTANVTVGALSGYTYSTTAGGTYTSSLSLAQGGGSYSQLIYVKFNPTAVQSYNGNIPVGGGGASSSNVVASGSGVNTAPTVTTGAASAITSTSATVAGTLNTASSCGTVTAYGIEYSTTAGFTNGTGTAVPSTNLSGTNFSSALSGLAPCTQYYTHAYATRAAGTTYGSQGTFTTSTIGAPTATAATGVLANGFTANWGAVAGATGYFLDVYTLTPLVTEDFTDGDFTSSPTWVGSTADYSLLTNTTLPNGAANTDGDFLGSNAAAGISALLMSSTEIAQWKFSWGSTNFSPATSNHFGVVLMSNNAISDITSNFNGYYLKLGVNGSTDYIELWKSNGATKTKVGDFSGAGNYDGSALTNGLNVKVTRSSSGAFTLYYAAGFTYASEPTNNGGTLTDNTFNTSNYFGVYTAFQNPGTSRRNYIDNIVLGGVEGFVTGYNNLSVVGTSKAVTGLASGTTYYYRVRAAAGCTSANSNVITVTTATAGCMDPLADNYNPSATVSDGSCTYCTPTITYNTPTPTPIVIGTGIPDQNMAVSTDCRNFKVGLNAFNRFVGAIIPAGNVYTTTTGYSPIAQGNPAPDPVLARWNLLGTVDLGTFNFTNVNVFLDLDFDPGATPVWHTANLSQQMITNGMGSQHLYQASENLAAPFWAIAFPGVTFNPNVPGTYDVRVRLESTFSNQPLVTLAIKVVVQAAGCMDPLADNYNPSATVSDGSCTYCTPTITYNTPTPTPIVIGTGIPDQNMAVSTDCRNFKVGLNAFNRFVGAIIPAGNVYTTTTGYSPIAQGNPAPDPVLARWNLLGTVDLGTFNFTNVNVFLDLDFDPGATPVWHTANLSQQMITNGIGSQHLYQASENLAAPFWAIAFPGVTFNPNVPGTYDVRVRLESTFSNQPLVTLAIQVVVQATEVTYYSQASGSVTSAIWDVVPVGTPGAATFNATANMVVQSGHTVTNAADASVKNLTVNSGGTLALSATTVLTVNGDSASFNGTVTAPNNSTLKLAGTSAMALKSSSPLNLWNLTVNTPQGTTTSATINFRGTLLLEDGTFNASTAHITLTSTAAGTGRLGPVGAGANYTGNLTMERYIPGGHTNWRMLTSAVAGQTVNAWKDDFYTAGFPGSHYPSFDSPAGSGILWPSIRWYNETLTSANANVGVVGVTSNTQPLSLGQGFMAWSGDNFNTTQAFTVDVTGQPNMAKNPVALPMSFTSSGNVTADGWNLVGNPLPCPLDFTQLTRGANVQNAYWIFDPVSGNNRSWTNGVGQGGLNGRIASSQGFWMKADGPAVTTTLTEASKASATGGGLFGGEQAPVLPLLNLSIASSLNTFSDEATIVFAQGTPAYDGMDALKMTFKTVGAPQIGVMSTDGHQLAVDFFGQYTTAVQIPLKVDVDVTGTYTISAGMSGITSLSCLSLTDLQTGTVTALADGASYSFAINADDDADQPRFVLNASAPLPFYNEAALCHDQPGRATVVVNEGPVNITWTDVFGNVLLNQANVAAGIAEFDGVAGDYQVHITPGGACATLSSDFTITAPDAISANLLTTATTCPNSNDGHVAATASGGTAPYTLTWSNGDTGNELTAAAGYYTATVTDAAGCTSSLAATIPAGEGTVAGFNTGSGTVVVNTPLQFTNTSVLADNYAWDFGDGSTSTDAAPQHTYAIPGTYTVTLTASGGACTDSHTVEITVESTSGINTAAGHADMAVWATPDQLILTHNFGNAPVNVDVFDATGRLALSRAAITKPERITLNDRSLNTGVWFVRVTSGEVQRTFRVPLVR